MPTAPPTACSQPGCPKYAHYRGRCKEHMRAFNAQQDTWQHEFYYTPAWRALKKRVREEEPLCRSCLSRGVHNFSQECDHIIPIDVAPELRLVRDNIQALCKSCHSRKTRIEMNTTRDLMR